MPVEMATSKMIAATIEKERDADDEEDRDEGLRSAAGLREERRTLAPSKEQHDAKESGKNGRAAAKIREDFRRRAGVLEAHSSPRIIFVDHNLGIAVIFGGRHDAEIVVAGAKDDDAGHERGGEAPAAGVSGVEGLRHFRLPSLRRGPSPRDRRPYVRSMAAITSQAKPKRPHARVADPSRVDGVRPWAGTRIAPMRAGWRPPVGRRMPKSPLPDVAAGLPPVLDCALGRWRV